MLNRRRASAALALAALVTVAASAAWQPPARAKDSAVDELARDVERVESVRAVKDLQRSYAQYAQFGLWREMADLFAADARFIWDDQTVEGRAAIAAWLREKGGGRDGLAPGALHTEMIEEPLVNLSVDGKSAKSRWISLAFLGDGKGAATIEGGIYENEYVREGGIWKIATSHFYPQYAGTYAEGWSNWKGQDLPIVPYHFTLEETGVPIPPTDGPAPAAGASLSDLEERIAALNDEDAVRNLQSAYGYYVDQKMWDDVVDLFTEDSVVEITKGAGAGLRTASYEGRDGVREAMQLMGPAGLGHGELNEHPQFDVMVEVLPGGREAYARGIEVGMLGDADTKTARWEINVFRNRFVEEDGLWKLKELRVYEHMTADYAAGWGQDPAAGPRPLPAFLEADPVAGEPVAAEGAVGAEPLLGAVPHEPAPAAAGSEADRIAEAKRKLARSAAWDGSENVSSAYGYYIDDFQWAEMGGLIAEHGNKQSPGAGYYFGRARVQGAATAMYGAPKPNPMRAGIAFHWRFQPVINVSEDGRSANVRTRLLQPGTGKQAGGSGLASGMYPNEQTVLENGVWKLWSVTIDEHYFSSAGWKGGWSAVEDRPPEAVRPSPLVERYPPDILLTDLGRREDGFRGGVGTPVAWPQQLPMWFNYRNPVSGREPERYWPDCVPCEARPDASMTSWGYQAPPTGPSPGTE